MAIPSADADLAFRLRTAASECSSRGLLQAAKWALELLEGLSPRLRSSTSAASFPRPEIPADELAEYDTLSLAKCYFDTSEYQRCAHALKDASSARAVFLRNYATLLAFERSQEDNLNVTESYVTVRDAVERGAGRHANDPFYQYLLAIIYNRQGLYKEARALLISSLKSNAYNWSAWLELLHCCPSNDDLFDARVQLPDSLVSRLFLAHAFAHFFKAEEALAILDDHVVKDTFEKCRYVEGQRAVCLYNTRAFTECSRAFDAIREADPFRLDDMDTFSNALFLLDNEFALTHLATQAVCIDKNRPETCCIIANYYARQGDHAKAILYFNRALEINSDYGIAWTLLGHEYLQVRNTNAAIDAYRRAVDANPRDYRAWHGLGQVYEMLRLFSYALFYYRKAVVVRPYDGRFWKAMGVCYENMKKYDSAIKCYMQAANDDIVCTVYIGKLYETLGDAEKAFEYYSKGVTLPPSESNLKYLSDACMFVAQYYISKGAAFHDQARRHLFRVIEVSGPARENARSLLRAIEQKSI